MSASHSASRGPYQLISVEVGALRECPKGVQLHNNNDGDYYADKGKPVSHITEEASFTALDLLALHCNVNESDNKQ